MTIELILKERDKTLLIDGTNFKLDESFLEGSRVDEGDFRALVMRYRYSGSDESPVFEDAEKIYDFLNNNYSGEIEVSPSFINEGDERGDYLSLYGGVNDFRAWIER
jgi:hypothetical protein